MSERTEPSEVCKITVSIEEYRKSLSTIVRELSELGVKIESRKVLADYIARDFLVFRLSVEEIARLQRTRHLGERLEKIRSLCSNDAFRCIVIIDLASLNLDPVVRETILGVFLELSFNSIPVFISYSRLLLAYLLKNLACKETITVMERKKIAVPEDHSEITLALAMLQTVPGIGPKRAARLLYEFGSIYNIASSTAEEISERAGVPLHLAEKLVKALRAEVKE